MDIRLERAGPEDAERFASMDRTTDTGGFVVNHDLDRHVANLRDSSQLCLRIIVDDRLVGYFVLVPEDDGKSVEFRRIVVAEKGRGIGQRAITLMEQFCRDELGRVRVWLDVFEHNDRGRHIYKKLGYRYIGDCDYDGTRAFVYDKTLVPSGSA